MIWRRTRGVSVDPDETLKRARQVEDSLYVILAEFREYMGELEEELRRRPHEVEGPDA